MESCLLKKMGEQNSVSTKVEPKSLAANLTSTKEGGPPTLQGEIARGRGR